MLRRVLISATAVAVVCAGAWAALRPDPDALRKIVETRCVAGSTSAPAQDTPCVKVDLAAHYVVLKDRKGQSHYLLLPTQRISGIESPLLLDGDAPNFFAMAWENRQVLAGSGIKPPADDAIVLAINSTTGRSQNQLHIHISCIRPDVRARLAALQGKISDSWTQMEKPLEGHRYWIRTATTSEFDSPGVFRMLAALPGASSHMGHFSVAVTELAGNMVMLATERDLLHFNMASAEELQEQDCTQFR